MIIEVENGKVKGYETTKEYGARFGVSDATVRVWISRGVLEVLKIGDVNWIKSDTPRPTKRRKKG